MSFAATVLANTDYARCPERFARRDALTPHSSSAKRVPLPRFVLVRVLREAEAEVGFDVAEVYRAECLSRVTVGPTAVGRSEGGQDRVGRKSISRQAGQFQELVGQADGSLCGRSRCPVGLGWNRYPLHAESLAGRSLEDAWPRAGCPTLRFTRMGQEEADP